MVKTTKKVLPIPVLSLDTSKPGAFIDGRATPDCQNVRIERTQIKKKEGYSKLGATLSGDVVLLGEFDREGTKYFFCLTTTKFYWWNNSGAVWTDYTDGTLNGTVVNPCSYSTAKISGKNFLVFTNYVDAIQKWQGSGNNIAALGGSPPIPKYLLGFNRYLLLGYIKDGANIYPERVQWPDYDDPESWTEGVASHAGSFDLDDGYEITGLFRLGNNAIVPKTDSIWVGYLTGDDRIWQFDSVERRLGFLVGNTVKTIPGGLVIGLSKHGIVQFNGLRGKLVVPGIFEDLKDYANPNLIQKSFAVIVAELHEYWLFIPIRGQDYPTRLYRYNYYTGQVYKDLVTNLTAAGTWTQLTKTLIDDLTDTIDSYTGIFDQIISDTFYPILSLGDKDGKVFKFDYDLTNEDGTAISAYWCSADIVPFPGYYSHFTELFFEGLGDTVTISYSTDEGATYTELETLTLTSSMTTYSVKCDIFAEKLRIKVSNAVASETFTMRNLYYKKPVQREAIER